MADVLFVLKSFVVTFILVVLMQIQVGDTTIETHFHHWLRGSPVATNLRDVAHGAARMIDYGYRSTMRFIAVHIGNEVKHEQKASAHAFGFQWNNDSSEKTWQGEEKNSDRIRQLQEKADDTYLDDETPAREDTTL